MKRTTAIAQLAARTDRRAARPTPSTRDRAFAMLRASEYDRSHSQSQYGEGIDDTPEQVEVLLWFDTTLNPAATGANVLQARNLLRDLIVRQVGADVMGAGLCANRADIMLGTIHEHLEEIRELVDQYVDASAIFSMYAVEVEPAADEE